MLLLAALLPLAASLAVARPIPAPSGSQLIRQGGFCLGFSFPQGPAQMLPCDRSGSVQWQATIVPGSSQYKLKNVLFGCYAVREANPNTLFCGPEDRASGFAIAQVTDDESMIVHGDQMGRVALHAIPGGQASPVYFGSETPENTSLFSFLPLQN